MAEASESAFEAIVVSQVRLLRECLCQSLANEPFIRVSEVCADLEQALESIEDLRPAMVLLDAKFDGGRSVATRFGKMFPAMQVVAVALPETEEAIMEWAEAGIAGYVPDTASMRDVPGLLMQIRRGEQTCPSWIAGSLLRGMARSRADGHIDETQGGAALTPRERVIVRHIGAGLSNKDIARRLDISLGTAKSHVHNIFGKLKLRSRAQLAARMMRGQLGEPIADVRRIR
jgi:DNA-binding NarL/FixJ family response regulator